MNILVEINGKPEPINKCDWVMYRPCGCTCGVLVASMTGKFGKDDYKDEKPVLTEEMAWKEFESKKRDRERRKAEGYKLRLMLHEDFKKLDFLSECDKCRKPKPAKQQALLGDSP